MLGLLAGGSTTAFGDGEAKLPPVTVRQGGREFSLRSLISGVSFTDFTRPPKMDETWSTVAQFRVTENGKPAPWEPVDVELRDAKGQCWTGSSYENSHVGDEIQHWFVSNPPGGGLRDGILPAPGEWKLRVKFFRTSGFTPEELWTVKGVPLPKRSPEQPYHVIESVVRQETRLSLRELLPAGDHFAERVHFPLEVLGVSVLLDPPRENLRVDLAAVKDDRGRSVQAQLKQKSAASHGSGTTDPTVRYHFLLTDLKPDARKVDLTFALHAGEIVEFPVRYAPGSP